MSDKLSCGHPKECSRTFVAGETARFCAWCNDLELKMKPHRAEVWAMFAAALMDRGAIENRPYDWQGKHADEMLAEYDKR